MTPKGRRINAQGWPPAGRQGAKTWPKAAPGGQVGRKCSAKPGAAPGMLMAWSHTARVRPAATRENSAYSTGRRRDVVYS